MRIILTGGGTGGHIYPAIAIGQAIKNRWAEAEILYIGTGNGMESKIVPEAGFDFKTVDVIGLKRSFSVQSIKALWKAIRGLLQAGEIIDRYKPQLVIGTGGYVCLPVVWAAARRGIPTIIHEQNAMPGITNKFLAGKVNRVLLTFLESRQYFPAKYDEKFIVTGLPVRPAIFSTTRVEGYRQYGLSEKKLTLLVVGGSRGARSINLAMLEVYKIMLAQGYISKKDNKIWPRIRMLSGLKLQVIHTTGPQDYKEVTQNVKNLGIELGNSGNIIIRPYLHDMEYALSCADLCVGRAGAAFLSEITAKGIPGILIPYPYATENHQEYNASSLVRQGAAEMILDSRLTGESLFTAIEKIMLDSDRRKQMSQLSKQAGKADAVEKIIQVVSQYL